MYNIAWITAKDVYFVPGSGYHKRLSGTYIINKVSNPILCIYLCILYRHQPIPCTACITCKTKINNRVC